MARRQSKKSTIRLDFSNVESRKQVDEGEQLLEVVEVERKDGNAGDYLAWKLKNEDGGVLYNNTSLSEQSLWATKAFLEALGVEIPEDEIDLDLEDMVGRTMMANIEHETYQGKKRPRIVDYWAADEEEEEEEEDKKKGKDKKKKKKKEPEKPSEDDVMDMSEDELEDVISEQELDIDLSKFKTLSKKRQAVVDALED